MTDDYVSPEEMAVLHGVDVGTIYRILRADQHRPPDQRRLPGAFKEGSKFRGEWRIPRATADNWKRSPKGRK